MQYCCCSSSFVHWTSGHTECQERAPRENVRKNSEKLPKKVAFECLQPGPLRATKMSSCSLTWSAAGLLEPKISIDSLPEGRSSELFRWVFIRFWRAIWWKKWKNHLSWSWKAWILPRCWSNWKRKCIFPVVGSNPWAFVFAVLFTSERGKMNQNKLQVG